MNQKENSEHELDTWYVHKYYHVKDIWGVQDSCVYCQRQEARE